MYLVLLTFWVINWGNGLFKELTFDQCGYVSSYQVAMEHFIINFALLFWIVSCILNIRSLQHEYKVLIAFDNPGFVQFNIYVMVITLLTACFLLDYYALRFNQNLCVAIFKNKDPYYYWMREAYLEGKDRVVGIGHRMFSMATLTLKSFTTYWLIQAALWFTKINSKYHKRSLK